MTDPRDIRDPLMLGARLLARREAAPGTPLSRIADYSPIHAPDYVSPEHPHEKCGDPRTIPSTLPN